LRKGRFRRTLPAGGSGFPKGAGGLWPDGGSLPEEGGFEQLLGRDLAFAGVQVRVSQPGGAPARYLDALLPLRVALSDERKEELVKPGIQGLELLLITGVAVVDRNDAPIHMIQDF